jgi:flavin reductase (DIM6/NTAB) family NADH-FMN oxidoreductase RutF
MEVDPSTLSGRDAYGLMIRCVVPRPIGWASTISPEGTHNLAPFSFFGGVSTDPMTVMLSVGRRKGEAKDTAANILATQEAVVHIPTRPIESAMVKTAAEAEAHVDEFELAGLTAVPSTKVQPPRVREAAIAMETVLRHHMEVGDASVDLFLLEVVYLHIADDVLVDGKPDPVKLQAIGRLGGFDYCDTSAPFQIEWPS